MSIAQGNIDPCTMEAFDVFSSKVNHVSTANIKKISGPFSRQEAFTQASKDSSVFAISSSKSRKETAGKHDIQITINATSFFLCMLMSLRVELVRERDDDSPIFI